jgi:hypothetical protein
MFTQAGKSRCENRLAARAAILLESHLRQTLHGGSGMAIRQDLLDMLVCPLCKAPVKLLPDESGLKCQACKRVYPVRDDVPSMLPEEAKLPTDE